MSAATDLRRLLRLIVITRPPAPDAAPLASVVGECLEAGCRAIQLRDKTASAADLCRMAAELVPLVRSYDGLLFINDRLDVALAARADGVHVGPDDIPVEAIRRFVPRPFLVGYSTDDPTEGRAAATAGADYLGVGAVFGTVSKAGLADEAIGPARVGEVARAAGVPVVGIGGITAENAFSVAAQGAGVAVLSAVMDADRPGDVVSRILGDMERSGARSAPDRNPQDP